MSLTFKTLTCCHWAQFSYVASHLRPIQIPEMGGPRRFCSCLNRPLRDSRVNSSGGDFRRRSHCPSHYMQSRARRAMGCCCCCWTEWRGVLLWSWCWSSSAMCDSPPTRTHTPPTQRTWARVQCSGPRPPPTSRSDTRLPSAVVSAAMKAPEQSTRRTACTFLGWSLCA